MNYDIIIAQCGVIPDDLMDQLKAICHHAGKPAIFGISNSELLGMKDADRMVKETVNLPGAVQTGSMYPEIPPSTDRDALSKYHGDIPKLNNE